MRVPPLPGGNRARFKLWNKDSYSILKNLSYSPMKPVKQNILSMIAVALIAILSAIVEGSFVYDYGAELGQVAESEKVFTAHDFADNPLYLSRESTADATLLTRSSATSKQAIPFATKIARSTICIHCGFPLPLVYQKPKEYYVYTLERMLC